MDWLDFPKLGFAGLLQQQIDGRTANFRDDPVSGRRTDRIG